MWATWKSSPCPVYLFQRGVWGGYFAPPWGPCSIGKGYGARPRTGSHVSGFRSGCGGVVGAEGGTFNALYPPMLPTTLRAGWEASCPTGRSCACHRQMDTGTAAIEQEAPNAAAWHFHRLSPFVLLFSPPFFLGLTASVRYSLTLASSDRHTLSFGSFLTHQP